jgi:hypothetical protein
MTNAYLSLELGRLSQEVKSLRRRNVCTVVLCLALAALLLFDISQAIPVSAQTQPLDRISARRIDIVDANGKRVGYLGEDEGAAGLILLHENGETAISLLNSAPTGPLLGLMSSDRNVKVILRVARARGKENVSGIVVSDQNSKMAWAVRHDPELGLLEMMKDSAGIVRAATVVNSRGEFKYHVQKSALEQVGEVLNWAGTLRSLTQ